MQETPLEMIKKQAEKLSLSDHIKLVEALVQQLKEKSVSTREELDWAELYGLGKGLWNGEDAQDYVSRLRDDRV
jgi:hypothetical protein